MNWISSLEPWQQVLGIILAAWAVLEILGRTLWYIWQLILWLVRRKWPGRQDWHALATQPTKEGEGNPANAFSGNIRTRWTSQKAQQAGMWFQLDMARMRKITRIIFDWGNSINNFPKRYWLKLSTRGEPWEECYEVVDSLDFVLPKPKETRYIRLEIIEPRVGGSEHPQPYWWSIHDIRVFEQRLWGLWIAEIK